MLRAQKCGGLSVGVILIVLAFSGCVALTGETAGENIDDTVLTTEIKSKLTAERPALATRVGVKTERGVVHLTGIVSSAEDRALAVRVARGVKGVRDVVDNLEVRP